jgi:glutathione S-transferase
MHWARALCSPTSRSARLVSHSKKIKVDEHSKVMDNGGDYRTVNPLGFVPALELDDGTPAVRMAMQAEGLISPSASS